MMRIRCSRAVLLCLLLGSSIVFAQSTKRRPLVLQLEWLQSDVADPALSQAGVTLRPLALGPLADGRSGNPQLVGENHEKAPKIAEVLASGSVPGFVHQALRRRLTVWGIPLEERAPIVLKGELLRLFVTETDMYEAEARIRFRLENRSGTILWENIAAGSSRRWGRSLKAENYNERITEALHACYVSLVNDKGFQRAWMEEGNAPALPPAMTLQELKTKVLAMVKQNVAEDVIALWVSQQRLSEPMRAEAVLDWKASGISDAVVRAALSAAKP
jgi:hypothetical protein